MKTLVAILFLLCSANVNAGPNGYNVKALVTDIDDTNNYTPVYFQVPIPCVPPPGITNPCVGATTAFSTVELAQAAAVDANTNGIWWTPMYFVPSRRIVHIRITEL